MSVEDVIPTQQKLQSVVFAVEPFEIVFPEALDLLKLHYDEIAPFKDIFKLNPDLAYYRSADLAGNLCIVTARFETILIGYIVMVIRHHIHYKDTLVATDDIHFIHPFYRRGSLGLRLISAAEKEMRKRKVRIMTLRTKVEANHGLLFERLGYAAMDKVYSKRLTGD